MPYLKLNKNYNKIDFNNSSTKSKFNLVLFETRL